MRLVKVFVMKVINMFVKLLKSSKAPLTIEFFIEHGFNMSPYPILPAKCGIANATFKIFLLDQKIFGFCIMAYLVDFLLGVKFFFRIILMFIIFLPIQILKILAYSVQWLEWNIGKVF